MILHERLIKHVFNGWVPNFSNSNVLAIWSYCSHHFVDLFVLALFAKGIFGGFYCKTLLLFIIGFHCSELTVIRQSKHMLDSNCDRHKALPRASRITVWYHCSACSMVPMLYCVYSMICFKSFSLSHPSILGVTLCFCTGSYAAAAAGRRFLFTR